VVVVNSFALFFKFVLVWLAGVGVRPLPVHGYQRE
jgi:hypothetical protein